MNGNIKQYLAAIADTLPAEVISKETYGQIYKMADMFADFAASEYIMETHLDTEAAEVDFSFRVLDREKDCLINGLKNDHFKTLGAGTPWRRIDNFVQAWPAGIDDVWLEMDYAEYNRATPQPCFFFNARRVKKGSAVDEELLFTALERILAPEQLQPLQPKLREVVRQLPADVGVFQVGVMLARNSDRVRIFTLELSREQVREYLAHIGWAGPYAKVEELFKLVDPYSDGQYILDFDVTRQGISEKIGINFGLMANALPDFLDNLASYRLCTDSKRRGVLAWSGSRGSYLGADYGYSALIKNISHFKVYYNPAGGLKAKAYLRVEGIYLKELFKIAAKPGPEAQPVKQGEGSGSFTSQQQEGVGAQPGYKEMQDIIKTIAQKSMLDRDFRELCLKDSQAAIKKVSTGDVVLPNNIYFLEEDKAGDDLAGNGFAYVLPPYLKPTWLTSK
jgi:hypothetical protein